MRKLFPIYYVVVVLLACELFKVNSKMDPLDVDVLMLKLLLFLC